MEVYRTKDKTVAKYVHDDGSETAVKTIPIETFGGEYGKVTNKFNVFISHSVGCPVGCRFCYLYVKKCPYKHLTDDNIVVNVVNAIKEELKIRSELHNMYCKLSWMGMGDALLDCDVTVKAVDKISKAIKQDDLCLGIDGVDIATTVPMFTIESEVARLNNLVDILSRATLNPLRGYKTPSDAVRLFYSLHSADNDIRNQLIPGASDIDTAKNLLCKLPFKLYIHHMLFNGINDSNKDINKLLKFMQSDCINGSELRFLRFNKCTNASFVESSNFVEIVDYIWTQYDNIKVQASPGSEVKAACGQFLLSHIAKKN